MRSRSPTAGGHEEWYSCSGGSSESYNCHMTQKFHSYVCIRRIESRYSNKYMWTHVRSSATRNNQTVETAQLSNNGWMERHIVVYPDNGILSSQQKGMRDWYKTGMYFQNITLEARRKRSHIVWIHFSEMPRTGKSTDTQSGRVMARGGEERKWVGLLSGHRVSFWGDSQVLELDTNGNDTAFKYKCHWNVYF